MLGDDPESEIFAALLFVGDGGAEIVGLRFERDVKCGGGTSKSGSRAADAKSM